MRNAKWKWEMRIELKEATKKSKKSVMKTCHKKKKTRYQKKKYQELVQYKKEEFKNK